MPAYPIHARVVRTLNKSPNMATEMFNLDLGPRPMSYSIDEVIHQRGDRVVDEQDVVFKSAAGPHILYFRDVGTAADGAAIAKRFKIGKQVPKIVPPIERVELDIRHYEPLGDDEFWALIDVAGGSGSERALDKLIATLGRATDDTIMRFAQAGNHKMFLLDHPERTLRNGEASHKDESADQRFAIIVGGRERFDLILADPTAYKPKWATSWSIDMTTLVLSALDRRHKKHIRVTTTFDPEAGSNKENWHDATPVVLVHEPFEGDYVEAAAEALASVGATDLLQDLAGLSLQSKTASILTWWGARAMVEDTTRAYEVVLMFTVDHPFELNKIRSQVVNHLSSEGRTVRPEIDLFETYTSPSVGGTMITMKRRSGLSADDFLAQFYSGR